MIELTKLNNQKIVINSDLIEYVEATPDTTISLTTGNKFVVRESVDELVDKVIGFRQKFNLYLQKKKEDNE
ncbi:MAG: flagellar FlbD family protein [Clostridia bacterium]|nr:flagellar FlbD family protein [Clostridia bacterium]